MRSVSCRRSRGTAGIDQHPRRVGAEKQFLARRHPAVGAEIQLGAIRHCGDSYYVTLGNGETSSFWEFNLRFKTDSSARGPVKGHPVLVGAGMGGDRAQVVFANPAEMSTYIRNHCE